MVLILDLLTDLDVRLDHSLFLRRGVGGTGSYVGRKGRLREQRTRKKKGRKNGSFSTTRDVFMCLYLLAAFFECACECMYMYIPIVADMGLLLLVIRPVKPLAQSFFPCPSPPSSTTCTPPPPLEQQV